ncbi:MAG: zinc ribbon domain-containing protein [Lachnospiraceae bacterium]|nr:zinc ribbon domain-containing protein [Lachnospiraceae bacterium]
MKYCVNCGKQIDMAANACPYCGAFQNRGGAYGYAGRQKAGSGMSLFALITAIGFLLMLIFMFLPLRGFNSTIPEEGIRQYVESGAMVNASIFNANIAVGIITLLLVIAGLGTALLDLFVKPLGRLATLIESVSVIWTFIALWIAYASAPRTILYSVVVAEFGPGYDYIYNGGYQARMQEAMSSEFFWDCLSAKVGFWLMLVAIIITVAGIVLHALTRRKR